MRAPLFFFTRCLVFEINLPFSNAAAWLCDLTDLWLPREVQPAAAESNAKANRERGERGGNANDVNVVR